MLRKIDNLRIILLDLPKSSKLIISLSIDAFLCIFTIWISFYLRLGEFSPLGNPMLLPSLISIIFAIPVFYLSGLYRTIFRYSGWPAMLTVSKSIFFYGVVFFIFISIITLKDVPRTIGIIQPLLLFLQLAVQEHWFDFGLEIYTKIDLKNLPYQKLLYMVQGILEENY